MKRSLLALAIAKAIDNPLPNLYRCRFATFYTTTAADQSDIRFEAKVKTIKKTSALGWTEFLIGPQS